MGRLLVRVKIRLRLCIAATSAGASQFGATTAILEVVGHYGASLRFTQTAKNIISLILSA